MSATAHSPTIALAPGEPVLEACRRVLANLCDAVIANAPGAVDGTDPEQLHDLRVAVRRTRSVLAEVRRLGPDDGGFSAHRPFFDEVATVTGVPRDLDVYLLEWPSYVEPLDPSVRDALEPVRATIDARRRSAHGALAEHLAGPGFAEGLQAWRSLLDATPPPDERPVGPWIAARITAAQRTVLRHGRAIDRSSSATDFHTLRKDGKRLRYLLECFGGLFHEGPRTAFVKRLTALQDILGTHQDADVHADELRSIGVELGRQGAEPAVLLATGQLVELLHRRALTARRDVARRFDDYDRRKTRRRLRRLTDPLRQVGQ